ncbi:MULTISPECIES: gamma carbonic anhydrase family protein [Mammaliicoccus]|nr:MULTISPECIES: gamma carbonic anhydrase family protein [Mammaliicoccus]MDQ7129612.1 gamma carbonic anhydrase family protein [Mammaliicoccus sciuri]PNY91627.1 gamma carbonic anhydrase family protein [Mammaliicoccus sciuri]PTJ83074.1 gamma carbonic anhydrase family protein [Mammaliicoccus sciuri]PTK14926.1 gamma carbonic anhydrase family protein [Mammaliicoccus sciuri]QDR63798.1 gamma carbonic anhydrase family protein [Mammaliicoccus sciuri]
MIKSFKGQKPQIDQSCYIAENATLIGDITIGPKSSVWFNSVIRGDVAPTIIGEGVNIQDLCCLHQSPNQPLIIENFVTIGHKVTLHSSIIRKHALIGMDSTILDGAEIGEYAFIGAGSLVPPGKKIPPHTLAFGRPAKVIRELTEDDYNELKRINASYIEKAEIYKADQ